MLLHALIPGIGPQEMIVIGIIGILLFGKRLPEVGKSLGKGIAEFKKGMRGIEDEIHSISRAATAPTPTASKPASPPAASNDLLIDPAVPKFEPPTAPPTPREPAEAGTAPRPYAD